MSFSSVFYFCLAVSLYPAISANRHKQELKEHYEHLNKIAEFDCGTPQPRLLTVQELLPHYEIFGKAYFPEVTVVHRCDRHTGSCKDATFTCGPTEISNISLPFKATFLEKIGDHEKGSWLMEYHHLDNHTHCGCSKLQKPTPYPDSSHYSPPDTSKSVNHEAGYSGQVDSSVHTSPQPPVSSSDQVFPSESVDGVTKPDEQVTNTSPAYTESQTYPDLGSGYTSGDSPTVNEVEHSSTTPNAVTSDLANDCNTWLDSNDWRIPPESS